MVLSAQPRARPGAADKNVGDATRTWCINACDDNSVCSTEKFELEDTRAVYAYMYCAFRRGSLARLLPSSALCGVWQAAYLPAPAAGPNRSRPRRPPRRRQDRPRHPEPVEGDDAHQR